jgi:hypothetical protein
MLPPADDDADLHTEIVDALDLAGHELDGRRIDAVVPVSLEGLPA